MYPFTFDHSKMLQSQLEHLFTYLHKLYFLTLMLWRYYISNSYLSLLVLVASFSMTTLCAQAPCEHPEYRLIKINGSRDTPEYQCSGEEASLIIRLSGGLPELDSGRSSYRAAIHINGETQVQTVASNGYISNTFIHLKDGDFWQIEVWDEAQCDTARLGYPQAFTFKKVKARIRIQPLGELCLGELVTLDGRQSEGEALRYAWQPATLLESRADRPQAKARVLAEGLIRLEVSDPWGCRDESSYKLQVGIPSHSGFTPNADGINDTWWLPCLEGERVELRIKDPLGKTVFHSKNYKNNWDGSSLTEQLPPGIYFYKLSVPSAAGQYLHCEGTVRIVR